MYAICGNGWLSAGLFSFLVSWFGTCISGTVVYYSYNYILFINIYKKNLYNYTKYELETFTTLPLSQTVWVWLVIATKENVNLL